MKKFKKILALGLSMAAIIGLVACGGNDTQQQAKEGELDKSKKLIIYTNSGSNGRDAWLKERAGKEGYNVEVVQIQGGDLGNRIVAEKNNPQADMVFGLNAMEYEKLKKEDVLDKWEPSWKDDVQSYISDKDGLFYPIVVQPLVNIINEDLKDAPKDYTELVKPEWKDKYTILNLGGGTSKTILASLLVRYKDDNGELGISKEGWDFVEKWVQNGHMEVQGEDFVGNVVSGKIPISELWGSGVIQEENERKCKFNIMSPEVGVPYVIEQVAMIKGSKNRQLAEDFANWFGSAAVQKEWMDQFGTIPCQKEALDQAPEEIKSFMSKVHQQEIDWLFVADNIDKWVEKVQLEFVK